jgi:hypothetical protein
MNTKVSFTIRCFRDIKLATTIVFAASLFAMVASTLIAGINVYALSGSNDKCATEFQKDHSVVTSCPTDRSDTDTLKDQCKQSDNKCSSSQTGQGVFSNNPNEPDNGAGIFEKFTH